MSNLPLISVIVPVYKVEKYLRRCIESIQAQTYCNLEIILVNDGSPDNCGAICDEYASRDKRIHVIHKTNGGLSDARNAGINVARGDYLGFIDSDDFIANDMYELLYQRIIEENADISICDVAVTNDGEKATFTDSESKDIFEGEDILFAMIYRNRFTVNVWNKLYRRELFQNIRFPKGMLYEDLATTYKLMMQAKCVVYTHSKKYAYVQRNGSIMNVTGFRIVKDKVQIVSEMWDYFEESDIFHKKEIQAGMIRYITNDIFRMLGHDNLTKNPEYRKALKKFISSKWGVIYTNSFISVYHKLIFVMYIKCPIILETMYKHRGVKK